VLRALIAAAWFLLVAGLSILALLVLVVAIGAVR